MAITCSEQKMCTRICRGEELWQSLISLSEFGQYSSMINTVRILDHSSRRIYSEWFVTLGGAPFSWRQIDTMDFATREIVSEAISGDFAVLRMRWNIKHLLDGTVHLTGSLLCESDTPLIALSCEDMLKRDFHVLVKELITAHIKNAEEKSDDERRFKRISVDYLEAMEISGNFIEARLTDFSRGGMAFRLKKGSLSVLEGSTVLWRSNTFTVEGHLHYESWHGTYRFAFSRPLGENRFRDLFARWSEGCAQPDDFIKFYEVVQAPASTGVRIRSRIKH